MHCGRVFYISSLFLNSLHDIQDIFDQSTLLVSILFVQIKLSSVSVGLFRIKENPHFFQILLQFLTMSSLFTLFLAKDIIEFPYSGTSTFLHTFRII
jgi:uncharacterized phage infection (PIP) family protein YhgE